MTDTKTPFSCDWQGGEKIAVSAENKSVFYKFNNNFTWEGVATEAYKPDGSNFANIIRNVLIGSHGESCLFSLRYFEVAKGGFSSLEKHQHVHVVICVRGKGKAVVGERGFDLKFMDTVYIAPNAPHQLLNAGDEPFGFLCIVNSERDKPVELSEEEMQRLGKSEETKDVIKR